MYTVIQSFTFNLQVYIVLFWIASTFRILGFTGVLIFMKIFSHINNIQKPSLERIWNLKRIPSMNQCHTILLPGYLWCRSRSNESSNISNMQFLLMLVIPYSSFHNRSLKYSSFQLTVIHVLEFKNHHSCGYPCKNGTGILAGSCQDPGKTPAEILAAGIPGSCRDSYREAGYPAVKISAGSQRESCRDSWQETGFPAAKISAGSRRESCRDSWREAGSRQPKSRQNPGGSLAGILGR